MRLFEFIRAMIFAMSLGIFATLTVLLSVINTMKVRKVDVTANRLFFIYLLCTTLASALFMAYYYFPDFFRSIDFVYCGAVVYPLVFFHHFLYIAIGLEKRFSPWHYIVPALAISALSVVTAVFPEYPPVRNYDLMFYIIFIFFAYYAFSGLLEMHRFYVRLSIAYGSTQSINQKRVVLFILLSMAFPVNFGLLPFIGGQQPGLFVSLILMAFVLSALVMNVPFLYSVIRHYCRLEFNRTLFESMQWGLQTSNQQSGTIFAGGGESDYKQISNLTSNPNGAGEAAGQSKQQENGQENRTKRIYRKYAPAHHATGQLIEVDKAAFESYFRKNKPYLNPNLTINDLTEPLRCNRTYLSKFINHTYKMNFNNYINSCRLQEMDRLQAMPGNRLKTPESLCSQAGFGSYRSYRNAMDRQCEEPHRHFDRLSATPQAQ